MNTIRMEDMSIEELKALIDVCQTEIYNKKEELKIQLMDEFEVWLKKVHEAGFEVWHNCEELCSWNMEITDKE